MTDRGDHWAASYSSSGWTVITHGSSIGWSGDPSPYIRQLAIAAVERGDLISWGPHHLKTWPAELVADPSWSERVKEMKVRA